MTPQERTAQLRETTADERWTTYRGMICAEVDSCTCAGGGEWPHEPGCGLDRKVADVEHMDDQTHVARWDPMAANLMLAVLAGIFDAHIEVTIRGEHSVCHAHHADWPCPEYESALSALDALDGGPS